MTGRNHSLLARPTLSIVLLRPKCYRLEMRSLKLD